MVFRKHDFGTANYMCFEELFYFYCPAQALESAMEKQKVGKP